MPDKPPFDPPEPIDPADLPPAAPVENPAFREEDVLCLLFTGGTISMQRDARAGGNVPAHDGAALVALAPELPAVAPFTVEDWGRYPACHMGPDTLWALRSRVAAVQMFEVAFSRRMCCSRVCRARR